MSVSKIFTIFFAILFIFGAAVVHSDEIVKTVPQLIKNAKSQISEVTVVELKSDLDDGKEFVLLDVRTAKEFDAGHIPKSVNLQRGLLEFLIGKRYELSPILSNRSSGGSLHQCSQRDGVF